MRVYKRKFDWDEARLLRNEGWSYKQIAERFGVSPGAVYRISKDGAQARDRARKDEWQRSGHCPECGEQATRTGGVGQQHRCRNCWAQAQATSVRGDSLRCVTCREWKDDGEFPSNVREKMRRGRHSLCRVCQTAARRSHRQRNREANNAYQREYRRRRRASLI